jgi:hypothetical protein
MNQPIIKTIIDGKKDYSIPLHLGFNSTSDGPNRQQRRKPIQKSFRNPFFGINCSSKYVQIIYGKTKKSSKAIWTIIDHYSSIKNRV